MGDRGQRTEDRKEGEEGVREERKRERKVRERKGRGRGEGESLEMRGRGGRPAESELWSLFLPRFFSLHPCTLRSTKMDKQQQNPVSVLDAAHQTRRRDAT